MAVPTSLSLSRRSKWLEGGVAAVGSIGVAIGAADPEAGLNVPPGSLLVALPVLGLLLFLYRRTAPIVPFACAALLVVVSPSSPSR